MIKMKGYLTLLVFIGMALPALAQMDHRRIDSLLPGTWKLALEADAKMMKTGGEMFLRDSVTFGKDKFFRVPGENGNWSWDVETDKSIVILDNELMEGVEYVINKLDDQELILVWGSSGYLLRYVRVK